MLVQAVVPLTQLRSPYLTPLGWKMFAYYGPVPVAFRLVHSDGRTEDLAPADVHRIARVLRPEVDEARFLPPVLCRRFSEATAVEFRTATELDWRRLSCR
jgi:hypothetical protein